MTGLARNTRGPGTVMATGRLNSGHPGIRGATDGKHRIVKSIAAS